MKRALFLYLFFSLFYNSLIKGQVNVTDNLTAAQLVQKLVGTGVSYSNAVLNCEGIANGSFNVLSSNLGLDSGIVLTTGRAKESNTSFAFEFGVNSPAFELASTDHTLANPAFNGDAQLDSILQQLDPTITSVDACALEFDFIPIGDTLQFNYVFGSEEYTSYSCDIYNDVFAFFLSGPGYPTATNIALIPGTNIPVAVNSTTDMSINFPTMPSLCTGMGSGSPFSQYYVDNLLGTSIVYNGFTDVFTAKAVVQSCSTYHIKLAIADASDGILDSGVFLEAGSFRSNSVNLSFASTLPSNTGSLLEGCQQGTVTVRRTKAISTPQTVYLYYSGSATKNVDYTPAPDSVIIPANDSIVSFTITALQDGTTEGSEFLGIKTIGNCSNIADSIGIEIMEKSPFVLVSSDTSFCKGSEDIVALHVTGGTGLNYYWTSNPSSVIPNASDSLTFVKPNETTTYTVQATIAGCPAGSASFTVSIDEPPLVNIMADTSVCLNDSMKISVDVMPDMAGNNYQWDPFNNLSSGNVKEPMFFSQDLKDHHYKLTVTSPGGCAGSDTINIHSAPAFELINVTNNTTIKYGDQVKLNADGALYYTWYPDKYLDFPNTKDPVAKPGESTLFTVYGLNEYGCRDSAEVRIDIDFSMVEYIPSAFSPNGDGRNDIFHIGNLKFQRLLEFRIFNRWGQEVFSTNDPSLGWDGRFKGVDQEVGVYHYLVRIARPGGVSREYKGDVTIVR
jgi:gliding motility-associated-like protein